MKVINFSDQNSIINQYLAEMRDKDYQQNRLLFRNNIQRVGEMMAYEISKTLDYQQKTVHTPLADAEVSVPVDDVVVATIFRAGLPFHTGFLNVFDHAGNAFVSAYRKYTDEEHTQVGIHIEYLATPDLTGKTLIIADPMLATGGTLVAATHYLAERGAKDITAVCILGAPEGLKFVEENLDPSIKFKLVLCAVDEKLNDKCYIVPGLGDAGDRLYGVID